MWGQSSFQLVRGHIQWYNICWDWLVTQHSPRLCDFLKTSGSRPARALMSPFDDGLCPSEVCAPSAPQGDRYHP
jgi:hypothetical protein